MKSICLVGGEDVHKRIALSKYLINVGFNVTIIGTSTHIFPDNIKYVSYNLNRSFSPISDYKTIKWYKRFFSENTFDIIHAFDTKPGFLLPYALKKTKTPITRTITGLGTIFISNSIFSLLLRKIYMQIHYKVRNRLSNTIFQNKEDKNIYLSQKLVNQNNHSLIYSSGIELKNITQRAKREGNPFTFICIARLVYEKGIINLLEAARICKDKGYNFKFLLVGPLEENSKRLNINVLNEYNDVIDWLGQRQDVLDLLLKSDAFVLPTFREGFARVILEAAAVGLPIISTNVPGVTEFASSEKEAILIEPNQSEALANAMIRLANDNSLAEKLAKNALKNVELFSLENVANQYISIFESVIENANK